MKNLELKKIEQLLTIIPNHPAIRIMHISQSGTELSDALASFVKEREYELLLNITNDVFYEEIKERYNSNSFTTVKKIRFEQRRYTSMAKVYDYVFVTADVPHEIQEQFIKNIYRDIKNAGNIVIFLEKNNLKLLDSWRQILEENYFVATNTIDLFKDYEIVISKKMHGWGG